MEIVSLDRGICLFGVQIYVSLFNEYQLYEHKLGVEKSTSFKAIFFKKLRKQTFKRLIQMAQILNIHGRTMNPEFHYTVLHTSNTLHIISELKFINKYLIIF